MKHMNPDGTINGVTYMAEITEIPPEEIKWMWDRMAYLVRTEGKTPTEAKAIMRAEQVNKPWRK